MSFVDPIVRSFRSAVNDQKTLLAKNVADSMFEFALWESRESGVGENVKNKNWPKPITRDYDFGTATIRWSVMGTPEVDENSLIDGKYTIPSPGSGTAGDDYCSTNEPVVSTETLKIALLDLEIDGDDLGGFYDAFSWPCNWNKLREGESLVIPLYTENADGSVNNPVDLGLDDFELRIRPACDPEKVGRDDGYENEICSDGERYVLKGDLGDDQTVIILWEITAKQGDKNGENVVITHHYQGDWFNDSAFTVQVLNGSQPFFESLKQSSKGVKNDGNEPQIGSDLQTLYKPTLRIITVHTLRDTADRIVPYLEYQFKAPINLSTDAPVSNTSKVVHVEVMIDGGYSETIEKTVGIAKSVSGFVIQQ